jgi:hypothetical protein
MSIYRGSIPGGLSPLRADPLNPPPPRPPWAGAPAPRPPGAPWGAAPAAAGGAPAPRPGAGAPAAGAPAPRPGTAAPAAGAPGAPGAAGPAPRPRPPPFGPTAGKVRGSTASGHPRPTLFVPAAAVWGCGWFCVATVVPIRAIVTATARPHARPFIVFPAMLLIVFLLVAASVTCPAQPPRPCRAASDRPGVLPRQVDGAECTSFRHGLGLKSS